jgi:hypothetical protein
MTKIVLAAAAGGLLLACSGGGGATGGTGGESGGTGGSPTGGGSCPPYMVPPGDNLMSPATTFKANVMPVFNANCGAVTCHGSTASTDNPSGLFLGASAKMGSDSAAVYTGLVGKAGNELTSMPFVTAGDPSKSYLMHKMDGDQCQFDSQCAGGSCLAEMPNGLGHVLPSTTRDIVRRWIAQGAKND